MEDQSWYVAQTQPCREAAVTNLLGYRGYETYVPLTNGPRGPTALFPSYVLIAFAPGWSQVRWLPGVIRLLGPGEHPALLPGSEIDGWRSRERKGKDGTMVIRLPKPQSRRLQPGQKVRVTTGSFTGLYGLYQGMQGAERVRILLDLLGGKVPVQMPLSYVQATPPPIAC